MSAAPMQAPNPQPKAVRITVSIGKGGILVNPDPAKVRLRQRVEWHISLLQGVPDAKVTIYFSTATPFEWAAEEGPLQITGPPLLIEARPNEPGDYKYGIRALAARTGQTIADEDPHLIVLP